MWSQSRKSAQAALAAAVRGCRIDNDGGCTNLHGEEVLSRSGCSSAEITGLLPPLLLGLELELERPGDVVMTPAPDCQRGCRGISRHPLPPAVCVFNVQTG